MSDWIERACAEALGKGIVPSDAHAEAMKLIINAHLTAQQPLNELATAIVRSLALRPLIDDPYFHDRNKSKVAAHLEPLYAEIERLTKEVERLKAKEDL